ncbi:MAG: 3-dehydroquinate synthase II [ANME-2 cluster archaeon]|nr:3-dehydroquinate synthase II [ANME-2 cluster archaeon]
MKKKSLWIKADAGDWDERKLRITTGLESGADFVLVNEDDTAKVRELGTIKVAAFVRDGKSKADVFVVGKHSEGDGTNPLPSDFSGSRDINQALQLKDKGKKTAGYVVIKNKKYEEFAAELGRVCDYVIVVGTDWKVIPLENLIAGLQEMDVDIIAGVRNAEETRLTLETMEHGSEGVLLDTDDVSEIKRVVKAVEKTGLEETKLNTAIITRVKQVGMGDRVCVDTCSLMSVGEGMLVGSQSNGLFLVHSESEDSPYVAARPFRVNAGAVHAYVKIGEKTQYLSELGAGDEVLVVNSKGEQRPAIVGRIKIEKRPMVLVEAKVGDATIKTILQNAETIKLVGKDGKPISVAVLKEGDEVLAYFEDTARHFGMKVDETIIEK